MDKTLAKVLADPFLCASITQLIFAKIILYKGKKLLFLKLSALLIKQASL